MHRKLRDEKPRVLKRLDDNGHVFEMDRFADEKEAEAQRLAFERRGHKQMYFLERDSGPQGKPGFARDCPRDAGRNVRGEGLP